MDREQAEVIAQHLIEAAETFAAGYPYLEEARASLSIWWHLVPEANDLFLSAVRRIVDDNAGQLSMSDTQNALTYRFWEGGGLSALALAEAGIDRHQLTEALVSYVVELVNTRTTRRLEFLVENIVLKEPAPSFFGLELVRAPEEDLQTLYKDPLAGQITSNAMAFARVDAPGDNTYAFYWGVQQVERYLNLLRGCGVEFMLGHEVWPLRVKDRNPVDEHTRYRELTPLHGSVPGSSWSVRGSDPFKRVFARVPEDLLSCLDQGGVDILVSATTGHVTEPLDSVVGSLETLGEACEAQANATRLLLVSIALEMLIGYGQTDYVTFRGQTAAIAEHAAFLIGGPEAEGRRRVDRRVRDLYGKGSGVRHGRRPDVSDDEIAELANMAHSVAMVVLDRAKEWGRFDDIDKWVGEMRYQGA